MPCTDTRLTGWQVFRCQPGQYDDPSQLADEWPTSRHVDVPATVATVFGADDDPDDFDWWFRTVVDAEETTAVDFRGLTFPATVFIDGLEVGQARSMFLPLAVECTVGVHEMCVRFQSLTAWLAVRRPRGRWRSSLVASPGMRWARTSLIGRAPIYGPVPAPVGFWRPVVATPARRVTTFSIRTDPSTGDVRISGTCGAGDGTGVTASITDAAGDVVAETRGHVRDNAFSLRTVVPEPRSWWPRGYGEPYVYRLTLDVDGEPVGRRILGFRRLAADRRNGGFQIRVNDVPIFCRGATWSPPDPVSLHVERRTIAELVATFADAGATMLRIVGGMVYEQDEFWELCAEMGVMVWQDAMQSTFDPPPEQSELIAGELAGVLDAVSGNPALTVVSGGSETLQRPEMLGLDVAARMIPLIEAVLPERVRQHSDALYVPASPSPPPGSDDLAIRPDTGVAHWFGVGGYLRPIADVRSASVKFAAECLAFANPPVPAAVERHFGSAAVAGHDPRWKAGVPRDRGASWDFEDIRDHYALQVFGEDLLATRRVDPERYLQLGRLAVAEAMRDCFAFWRRSDSGCSGALVLAGKDMCPGAGWGLLDVDGTPKPALAVLRRVWAPVAVVIADDGLAGLRIDVHNDTDRMVSGPLRLRACRTEGSPVDATTDVVIPPHSSVTTTDADVAGAFRDLSHAFRFGPATADAIEVVFEYADGAASARDAMIVTPRGGQLGANVEVTLGSKGDDLWTLDVVSQASLRYVCLDVAGWEPSDDFFHLPVGPHAASPPTKDVDGAARGDPRLPRPSLPQDIWSPAVGELTPQPALGIRIGCDVVALADVEYSITQFGERYLRRVYTPVELQDCAGPDRVARLAARFAAKEAVVKAFAEPSAAFGLHDVEVRRVRSMPTLVLSGAAAALATKQGWVDSALSLSHTTCHAAAAVAVTCADAVDQLQEGRLVVNGRVASAIAAGLAPEAPTVAPEEH